MRELALVNLKGKIFQKISSSMKEIFIYLVEALHDVKQDGKFMRPEKFTPLRIVSILR